MYKIKGVKTRVARAGYPIANALVGFRNPIDRPLLVIGNGRSGTSWIGDTLSQERSLTYYREPCHPGRKGLSGEAADAVWTRYVPPGGSDRYFQETLGGAFDGLMVRGGGVSWRGLPARVLQRPRILVKEVAAFLSLDWLYQRWKPEVLVVVRHPCAYAASVRALRHDAAEIARFDMLRNNKTLQQNYIGHLMPHLTSVEGPLEASVASWAIRNYINLRLQAERPEWQVIYYEELARNPAEKFRSLFLKYNLHWDKTIAEWIRAKTTTEQVGHFTTSRVSSTRIDAWRQRLSSEEVARIRRVVEPFDLPIYSHADNW